MTRLRPFLIYVVVSAIHLGTLVIGWDYGSTWSKWFLMPTLLLCFLLALPHRRGGIALFGSLGIALSWAGDVFLGDAGSMSFLIGIACFLLAHCAYLVMFVGPMRESRPPWWAVTYFAWVVALVGALAPYVGGLLIPVAAYGLVLALSATFALGTNRTTALGAFVFLISDTVLACKTFYPGFTFWQIDFVIMLFYVVGQGLIILGAVERARRDDAVDSAANAPA